MRKNLQVDDLEQVVENKMLHITYTHLLILAHGTAQGSHNWPARANLEEKEEK